MSGSAEGKQSAGSEGGIISARKLYDDFGRGDVEAVLDSFNPCIEWREAEGNP